MPFDRIGPYQLVRGLGVGGMGEVYLAHDLRLERMVAIKLLPADFSADPEALARFRREAVTLAMLNHPNIATIHGFEDTPAGGLALVLEYVEGESLAARLARGAMPIPEAMTVCAQTSEALELAHARGVIHRDLKPGNVMLGPRGLVKVVDFGLARRTAGLAGLHEPGTPHGGDPIARAAARAATTGAGPVSSSGLSGTPGYMSPEQVLAGRQDERSDVFAFGAVLYECLTGQRAFPGGDDWEIMARVLGEAPHDAALPERLPARVRTLLQRCLEKDAERRLPDIRTARIELEEALGVRRAAALRSGERPETPHNLPRPATRFIGRARELERCREELLAGRLLTLLGMGGCGKTRLALRVAEASLDDHPDGVWFADLGAVRDAERVTEVVAAATGARGEPGRPLEQTLREHLGDRHVLILMDNCEDALAGCRPLVPRLLAECPNLRILATSREAIGVPGECLHALPALAVAEAGSDPAAVESIELFVDRAQSVMPGFALSAGTAPVVAEICRRLDGIPLALELAAARVRVLGVEQILARLGDRFRLLRAAGAVVDQRQQTLRAVIQWSVDHLAGDELGVFRALSVFAGACSLEAAVRVCGDLDEFDVLDILQRLSDKSLLIPERDPDGGARYAYLESVRQLAAELRDAAGETAGCRDQHLDWFLQVARESDARLKGSEQKSWLARIDRDHEDLLAAHAWALHRVDGGVAALDLAASMTRYWSSRGLIRLARRTLEASLARAVAPGPEWATAAVRAASMAIAEGDYDSARGHLERSLQFYRGAGDGQGVARALSGLGTVAICQRDYALARASIEESLTWYRARQDRHAAGGALHNLGYVALRTGDVATARTHLQEAAELLAETGDQRLLANTSGDLALCYSRAGEAASSLIHLATALRVARELHAPREAVNALHCAAEVAAALGDPARGLGWLAAADAARERIGFSLAPDERTEQVRLREAMHEIMGSARETSGETESLEEALEEALVWVGQVNPGRP